MVVTCIFKNVFNRLEMPLKGMLLHVFCALFLIELMGWEREENAVAVCVWAIDALMAACARAVVYWLWGDLSQL